MRCDRRLLIAVLGVVAAAVGLLLEGHPLWRLILAAPLVLVLPGAALLRLFPGRLPAPGRYALTAGLSMAVCLLGAAGLVGFGTLFFGRLGREEQMMVDSFGNNYRAYMERTYRVFPGIY